MKEIMQLIGIFMVGIFLVVSTLICTINFWRWMGFSVMTSVCR